MAYVPITVSLEDGDGFERAVLDALGRRLTRLFRRSQLGIRNDLESALEQAIRASPEYSSLLTDRLWHELGVLYPDVVLNDIINALKGSMVVEARDVKRDGKSLVGGMTIKISRSDFSELFGVRGTSFISENGYQVDWLKWLLIDGDSIVVFDFHFESGHEEHSRTGDGIMVESGSWRVPSEFSGVSTDNWITRTLSGMRQTIRNIIIQGIKRNI